MQLPYANASSAVLLDYYDSVEGAVEAWQDAEILSEIQQAAVKAAQTLLAPVAELLRQTTARVEASERAERKAKAQFAVRDVILDLRVMALSDAVLNGPANRNRQDPLYQNLFRDQTASEITRSAVRDEPELVKQVLSRYDALPEFPQKAAAREPLHSALQKSLEARDRLDEAEQQSRIAQDDDLRARLGLRQALEQAYGTLRSAFPGRRDFVESFFPKVNSARTRGEGGGASGSEPGKD